MGWKGQIRNEEGGKEEEICFKPRPRAPSRPQPPESPGLLQAEPAGIQSGLQGGEEGRGQELVGLAAGVGGWGGWEMINIKKSPTADTRTCDFANVSRETLEASSHQHINDVREGLQFFVEMIFFASQRHDYDKISDIDGFHRDFLTGFKQTEWWDRHRKLNRHHLTEADGIPDDVNLIDVLDFIADCIMAGMARSGSVYSLQLPPELLEKAFQNTVELLKKNVQVVE